MAYIEKRVRPSGKLSYRARIRLEGSPHMEQTFLTKGEAVKWARRDDAILPLLFPVECVKFAENPYTEKLTTIRDAKLL